MRSVLRRRALLVLQGLAAEAVRRGHEVRDRPGCSWRVGEVNVIMNGYACAVTGWAMPGRNGDLAPRATPNRGGLRTFWGVRDGGAGILVEGGERRVHRTFVGGCLGGVLFAPGGGEGEDRGTAASRHLLPMKIAGLNEPSTHLHSKLSGELLAGHWPWKATASGWLVSHQRHTFQWLSLPPASSNVTMATTGPLQ